MRASSSIILVFLLVALFSPTFSQGIRNWFRKPKGLDHHGEDSKKSSGTPKDLGHRETNHVHELFNVCQANYPRLLIRKADYQSQASRHLCTNGSHTRSPDIECVCKKPGNSDCTATFSLRMLSRIYSAVDARDNTAWADFLKDFHEHGNYKITYECIELVRGLTPCVKRHRPNVTRIAFFPTANLTAKDQQCQMMCTVTRNDNDRSKRQEPVKWVHHFVLLNRESENKNHAKYRIEPKNQTWTRFEPSRLEEETIRASGRNIQLRFAFQNVSEVVRFWLEFRDTKVDVDCEEMPKTTSTPMMSTKTLSWPATTPSSTNDDAGSIVHYYVIPALLLICIAIVAVGCLTTKRWRKKTLNEEASQLLATPPSFPNPDPDSSHHPQEASNPSPSRGRHVTGSGNDDDDNPYDCLDHGGSQARRGRRRRREESDDYSHVVRCTSDGAYDRCHRESGRRQEVLDNPYDHTFVITD